MCLALNNGPIRKLARGLKRITFRIIDKPIQVYKILVEDREGLLSPYRGTIWEPNKVMASSRKYLDNPTQLTVREKANKAIYEGLHFYLTKKAAKKNCDVGEEVWMAEMHPKDIIAFGQFCTAQCVAAHKAKLVKRVY